MAKLEPLELSAIIALIISGLFVISRILFSRSASGHASRNATPEDKLRQPDGSTRKMTTELPGSESQAQDTSAAVDDEINAAEKALSPAREVVQTPDVKLPPFWALLARVLFPVILITSYVFQSVLRNLDKSKAENKIDAGTVPVRPADAKLEERLSDERQKLEDSLSGRTVDTSVFFLIVATMVLFSVIALLYGIFFPSLSHLPKQSVGSFLAACISLIYAIWFAGALAARVNRFRGKQQRVQELDFQIDLQRSGSESERRAEKTVRLHEIQLQNYYQQNLGENRKIFWVGVSCLFLGVLIIALTIWVVYNFQGDLPDDTQSKIIISILGAIGSILTNYIAVIFLKMHAVAANNLGRFHSRLVETHQVLFANLVASRIEDKNIRWDTLSGVALNLSKRRAEEKEEKAVSEPKAKSASKVKKEEESRD
jgi:flagellar biogenesis protein FliO